MFFEKVKIYASQKNDLRNRLIDSLLLQFTFQNLGNEKYRIASMVCSASY
jgi:hypothetical protein